MSRTAGRICVVTGAASGIGLAVAKRFAAAGDRVIGLDRQPVADPPAGCEYRELDVSQDVAVAQCIEAILAQHGAIDVLVNAAGIARTWGTLDSLPIDDWDKVMAVNYRGTLLMCRAVLRAMLARGRGAIVNVGSTFGLLARQQCGPYAVSKAAVIHLTRCLAIDHAASGVRVNCVCPGLTHTVMTEYLDDPANAAARARDFALHAMNRAAQPEEIAAAITYLASEDASFITGEALAVDGGYTAGKWP